MKEKKERNKDLVLKRKSGWSFRKLATYFNIKVSTVFEIWKLNEDKYSK